MKWIFENINQLFNTYITDENQYSFPNQNNKINALNPVSFKVASFY